MRTARGLPDGKPGLLLRDSVFELVAQIRRAEIGGAPRDVIVSHVLDRGDRPRGVAPRRSAAFCSTLATRRAAIS